MAKMIPIDSSTLPNEGDSTKAIAIANAEVSVDILRRLANFGKLSRPETDMITLALADRPYTRVELLDLVMLATELQADECSFHDGELYLWWD